jgi:hypothetical protein
MAQINSLDELPNAEYAKCQKAIRAFRKGTQSREQQHILYEVLTNAGLSSEYADEFINLEMECEAL